MPSTVIKRPVRFSPYTLCLMPFTFYLFAFLCSCSVQKQVSKMANNSLLQNPVLSTASVGIAIMNYDDKKFFYRHNSNKLFTPASNTKIITSYAAMKYLGDSLDGIKYKIEKDTVCIEPTGDPSLLNPQFSFQPVYVFLKQFHYIKIINPAFAENYWGAGWSWDDYPFSYMSPRSNLPLYGNRIWVQMHDKQLQVMPKKFSYETAPGSIFYSGFDFEKKFDENKIIFKDGDNTDFEIPFTPYINDIAAMLADTLNSNVHIGPDKQLHLANIVHTQPADSVLKIMMHNSDNFLAEQLLLMVSDKLCGTMNDKKIIDSLLKTDYADLPQAPQWVDGSGLSRLNLFSPENFVWVLDKMKTAFAWNRITTVFPSADEGTLKGLYKNLNGKIYAKTGTLSNCIALSGYIITHKNRTLIFSVLINGHNRQPAEVRHAIENFIEQLAAKY